MSDADLLAPIAGDNPAGASVRGESVYQQIKLARFEEDDVPQGEWQRTRKTADFVQVVKLATEVLATQSKDLQVAAWLTEAWTRREGFAGLTRGLQLLHALLDRFWDHVHPEPEDGDLELRAAPLEWVELYLGASVRAVALTRAGHGLTAYRDSRQLGYEESVKADSTKHAEWQAAVAAGKVSADAFDRGLADTPGMWVRDRVAEVDAAIAALDALAAVCEERFGGEYAPRFIKLREMLAEVRHLAGQLLAKKAETDPELTSALAAAPSADAAGGEAVDGGSRRAFRPRRVGRCSRIVRIRRLRPAVPRRRCVRPGVRRIRRERRTAEVAGGGGGADRGGGALAARAAAGGPRAVPDAARLSLGRAARGGGGAGPAAAGCPAHG